MDNDNTHTPLRAAYDSAKIDKKGNAHKRKTSCRSEISAEVIGLHGIGGISRQFHLGDQSLLYDRIQDSCYNQ
ncbi:hypothetical protein DZS_46110 [Dickeya ananatis]